MQTSFFFHTKKLHQFLTLLLLVGVMTVTSCKTSATKSSSPSVLIGRWQETWDNGTGKNNVEYSDVYRIEVKGSEIAIFSITHKYFINKVTYENRVLQFELVNTDKYAKEAYTINYTLNYNAEQDMLEGKALTNKGVQAKILWKRYN